MGTPINPISTDTLKNNISNPEIIQFLLSQKKQIPPKYSALHINGKRAYSLAKNGIEFDIPERPINIKEVIILDRKPLEITLELTISS